MHELSPLDSLCREVKMTIILYFSVIIEIKGYVVSMLF